MIDFFNSLFTGMATGFQGGAAPAPQPQSPMNFLNPLLQLFSGDPDGGAGWFNSAFGQGAFNGDPPPWAPWHPEYEFRTDLQIEEATREYYKQMGRVYTPGPSTPPPGVRTLPRTPGTGGTGGGGGSGPGRTGTPPGIDPSVEQVTNPPGAKGPPIVGDEKLLDQPGSSTSPGRPGTPPLVDQALYDIKDHPDLYSDERPDSILHRYYPGMTLEQFVRTSTAPDITKLVRSNQAAPGAVRQYLLSRVIGGAAKYGPNAIGKMQPHFAARLEAFLKAASAAGHDIRIHSGYRDKNYQAGLFRDKLAILKRKHPDWSYAQRYRAARHMVAPPGRSNHGRGIAADLTFMDRQYKGQKTPAVKWAHANARKYGLYFRMSWEDWHIEPYGKWKGGARTSGTKLPPSTGNWPIHNTFVDRIKHFEGFSPRAYDDVGTTAIGYGTKGKPGEVITREEADRRLKNTLSVARRIVEVNFGEDLPRGPLAALTSLTMNAGTTWIDGRLGKAVRARDWAAAKRHILSYNKAKGKVLRGLVRRRREEATWFDIQ